MLFIRHTWRWCLDAHAYSWKRTRAETLYAQTAAVAATAASSVYTHKRAGKISDSD